MEDRLRAYMDEVFREVKPSRKSVELKEEILQNLTDKYHDLLAEGKSPEAAFNIAVASIGDMDELLRELRGEGMHYGVIEDEEIRRVRKKSAALTAIAIALYITCVVPPVLLSHTGMVSTVGPALMFLMIAAATGLIVYGHMIRPRYRRSEDSIVDEFREWQDQTDSYRRTLKAVLSALWSLTVVVYIIVSFTTGAWHITWVIFLISTAIQEIIKAAYELKRRGGNE